MDLLYNFTYSPLYLLPLQMSMLPSHVRPRMDGWMDGCVFTKILKSIQDD